MMCRGCLECLLKLLNFLLTLAGLSIIGYGIYLFVEYKRTTRDPFLAPVSNDVGFIQLGRPMLMTVFVSESIFDKLPKLWFIYLFIAVGVVLLVISCFGCIGAAIRNSCCLSCYAILVFLLIMVEIGCAALVFFDKNWKKVLPTDKTGDFYMIYAFLKEHWSIVKWVALGAIILQAVLFLLALVVRAANRPAEYDSDDELIMTPRQTIRQPLVSRPPGPATGVPVSGLSDQRPSRNDAWSTRMREKYGLDTSEFTYSPSESNRHQLQASTIPAEESSRCTIM